MSNDEKPKFTDAPWHQVIVEPGGDQDALIADLIASGKAKEGDNFMVIVLVEPIGAGYPSHVLDRWGHA